MMGNLQVITVETVYNTPGDEGVDINSYGVEQVTKGKKWLLSK